MIRLTRATVAAIAGGALMAVPLIAGGAGATVTAAHTGSATLTSLPFLATGPTGAKGPDDITSLAVDGLDGGRAVIWTAFQNGINPDGTPGTTGGPTQSNVAGVDPVTGALVRSIMVTGKVDGLTADRALGRLVATVNEDSNSALNLIDPQTSAVTTYAYSPDPGASSGGGTDSIAIKDGRIIVVHSNPSVATEATEYKVSLDNGTHTARLQPLFFDDSTATDAGSGVSASLNLMDPDTNFVMPGASPRFAGQLATVSQGDGLIVFGSHPNGLKVLNMTDNLGALPPIDGLAVATADHGTLYVVDSAAGKIEAFDTSGWPAGTVFVGEPNDNNNPFVGTLDLSTGKIQPLLNKFVSPKGLLFVPGSEHEAG
jgi:hypothetical protein